MGQQGLSVLRGVLLEAQGKPRMAESSDGLYKAIAKASREGVVGPNGRVLYPAIVIVGEGTFQMKDNDFYIVIGGGIGVRKVDKEQYRSVINAIETDTAQVVLMSGWGGSGNRQSRKSRPVKTLHSPSGLSWKKV